MADVWLLPGQEMGVPMIHFVGLLLVKAASWFSLSLLCLVWWVMFKDLAHSCRQKPWFSCHTKGQVIFPITSDRAGSCVLE